jgi:mannose-6-phosphate isomerase
MEIMRATEQDLEELLSFYQRTADQMEEREIRHWHWGRYPNEELIRGDVERGEMYCLRTDGAISAAVSVSFGQEDVYESMSWTCGLRPGSIHRIAVHPAMQGAGLGGLVLDDVQQILRRGGCDCIRCDTSENNAPAIRFYEKLGFRRCGRLHWDGNEGDNITFDKALKRETPLWPIRLRPAFRGGEQTPWGGDRLRTRFGKETGGKITGESLEASCIPGLESTDTLGRKLPDLIMEFGEKLVGKYADRPFPLLLKLIDARDQLSVQVHPDDEYAAIHEGGKFGKTEAWLILDAPEGSELVYGLHDGITLRQLRDACEKGKAVEPLLRRVRVVPGDVCYIPAGCVHAIGAGIMLYEIQESSDLTYRFYDWDRKDENGNGRELHLEQALAVTNLKCAPRPVHVSQAYGTRRLLNEEPFTLDVIRCGDIEFLPEISDFGILTSLRGELTLKWESGEAALAEGETCLLPKSAPKLHLRGEGYAALAMPNA